MGELAGILMIISFSVFTLGSLVCIAYLVYAAIERRKYKGLLVFIARYSTYLSLDDWSNAYGHRLTQPELIEAFEYTYSHEKDKTGKKYEKPNWYSMPVENKATSRISAFGNIKNDTPSPELEQDLMYDHKEH